jgi:hypothetical protein
MNIRGVAVTIALSICVSGCEGPKGEPGAVGPAGEKGELGPAGPPWSCGPARSSGCGRSCWPSRCCRERHSSYTPRLRGRSVQRGVQPERGTCDRVLRSAQNSCDLNQRKNSHLSKDRGYQPARHGVCEGGVIEKGRAGCGRCVRKHSGNLLPPSPPAEQATALALAA